MAQVSPRACAGCWGERVCPHCLLGVSQTCRGSFQERSQVIFCPLCSAGRVGSTWWGQEPVAAARRRGWYETGLSGACESTYKQSRGGVGLGLPLPQPRSSRSCFAASSEVKLQLLQLQAVDSAFADLGTIHGSFFTSCAAQGAAAPVPSSAPATSLRSRTAGPAATRRRLRISTRSLQELYLERSRHKGI